MIHIYKGDTRHMDTKNLIGHEVKILSNLIRRHISSNAEKHSDTDTENNKEGNRDELTGMQSFIIRYLYINESEEIFQRDIEKNFNIRRSTATVILQRMEKRELIEKVNVSYDARLKRLELTSKALKVNMNIEQDIESFEAKMRQGISDEHILIFMETIKKIISNIE